MSNDKQLNGVAFDDVLEKRRLGQALSAKEFAVPAGISYSTARDWFHSPGFPVFRGKVYWQDFAQWRKAQAGQLPSAETKAGDRDSRRSSGSKRSLPIRGERILAEATTSLGADDTSSSE